MFLPNLKAQKNNHFYILHLYVIKYYFHQSGNFVDRKIPEQFSLDLDNFSPLYPCI